MAKVRRCSASLGFRLGLLQSRPLDLGKALDDFTFDGAGSSPQLATSRTTGGSFDDVVVGNLDQKGWESMSHQSLFKSMQVNMHNTWGDINLRRSMLRTVYLPFFGNHKKK